MRIDNHMAGYRPPPPKSKNKGAASSGLLSAGFMPSRANRSSLPQDDGAQGRGRGPGFSHAKRYTSETSLKRQLTH